MTLALAWMPTASLWQMTTPPVLAGHQHLFPFFADRSAAHPSA